MLSKIACLRHSSGDWPGFDSQTSQASKPIRGQIMDYDSVEITHFSKTKILHSQRSMASEHPGYGRIVL